MAKMNEQVLEEAIAGGGLGRDLANGRPVVLVSHGFQSNYERGFSNGLASAGVAVTLISSDRTDYAGLSRNVRTVNLRGSQDERRPKWAKVLNLLAYQLRLMIYALRHRRSIFHVIGLIQPAWLWGVLGGLWFRAVSWRYTVTVHDLLPHEGRTRANFLAHGLSFRLADRLVVHTPLMRDQLIGRFGISAERIVIMEHGIEPLARREMPPATRRPDGCLRLLCFGVVSRYKGIDILLESLGTVDFEFSLSIVGFCPDKTLERELRARIARHRAAEAIAWRNEFVPEAEIEALFANADALVLPYRHIDQSGVLFQALRFGVPVVATRVGSFERYVSEAVGETCAAEDVGELKRAIERMRARLSAIDRREIAEIGLRYEWPTTVRTLAQAYA
jgi:glycosyltransferase involved in cell wall biosynthesis